MILGSERKTELFLIVSIVIIFLLTSSEPNPVINLFFDKLRHLKRIFIFSDIEAGGGTVPPLPIRCSPRYRPHFEENPDPERAAECTE